MVCVQCGKKTEIINSRPQVRNNQVWRRRRCYDCKSVFSTSESANYDAIWTIMRPSRPLLPFSRDKLLLSIYKSCEHRPKALKDASDLTETVIAKLRLAAKDGQITNQQIIQAVQVALNRFDKAASVHYQAFHKKLWS